MSHSVVKSTPVMDSDSSLVLTCDESMPSSEASSFDSCRRNFMDIMKQSNQLRSELQSIRNEFIGIISTPGLYPDDRSTPATAKKLFSTPAPHCSPNMYVNSLDRTPINQSLTPTRIQLKCLKTNSPLAVKDGSLSIAKDRSIPLLQRQFFDSPVLDKTVRVRHIDEIKVSGSKRKQYFDSPVLAKVPKMENTDFWNVNEENRLRPILTPVKSKDTAKTCKRKSRSTSRRSSLQKLLSPIRRRSGSLERAKSRLSIMTNGLLFNKQPNAHVDLAGSKRVNSKINTVARTPVNRRLEAEGAESGAKRRSLSRFAMNDTTKTAELSSGMFSSSSRDSITPSENSVVTDAIRTVTCNFITPVGNLPKCRSKQVPKGQKHKRPQTYAVNRINVSELMDTFDENSTLLANNRTFSVHDRNEPSMPLGGDAGGASDSWFNNISTIAPSNMTNQTLREQVSSSNITDNNILHSTFDYPLHSTMYNPLQCTIRNINNVHSETLELSLNESDSSLNNNSSDCDSSVLSIDIDSTTLEVKVPQLKGDCNVCKVTQMRRQMAQPHLERQQRRAPVGLSQTDIDLESKLPLDRPAPIGASQSILDSDKTLVAVRGSNDGTLSATMGSVPNFTALSELGDITRNVNRNASIGMTKDNRKLALSSGRRIRSKSRSSRREMADKENIDVLKYKHQSKTPKVARHMFYDCQSEFSDTPSSASHLSHSQKRDLKRKFKSFNSSANSSQHTTLAFF